MLAATSELSSAGPHDYYYYYYYVAMVWIYLVVFICAYVCL